MTTRKQHQFIRHYVEMVAVMFLGMVALGLPAGWLYSVLGRSWSQLSPAMMLFAMAVTMTVPMVAWMRYRGHAWQPSMEMVGAMLLPAFAAMALLWTGVVHGTGALMVFEHVAMLAGMLAVMLLRREEYSGAAHDHGAGRNAIAAHA